MAIYINKNRQRPDEEPENNRVRYLRLRKRVFDEFSKDGISETYMQYCKPNVVCVSELCKTALIDAAETFVSGVPLEREEDDAKCSRTGRFWNQMASNMEEMDYRKMRDLADEVNGVFESRRSPFSSGCHQGAFSNNNADFVDCEISSLERQRKAEEYFRKIRMQTVMEAEKMGEKIISDAKKESERIIAEAKEQRKVLIEDGRREKEKFLDELSEEEFRKIVESKLKGYIAGNSDYENGIRHTVRKEHEDMLGIKADMTAAVSDGIQTLQSSLIQNVDSAVESIRALQNQMYSEMDNFKRELYKAQYKEFASCYVTIDKMIDGMEAKLSAELSQGDAGHHSALAREIERYLKNFKILRNSFESCLAGIGVKIFSPCAGDPFNERYYTIEGGAEYTMMKVYTTIFPSSNV